MKNNVYVDGVLNSKWSFRSKVFTLELGDIAPNEKRVVKITVEFKTDAGGKTYTNLAAATGDNGSASGRSPEIEVVSSGSSGTPVLTDIHYQLFNGYGDGLWRPNDRVSLQEACTVVYRLIANGGNTWLPRGIRLPFRNTSTIFRKKQSISFPSVFCLRPHLIPLAWMRATITRSTTDLEERLPAYLGYIWSA